MRLAFGTDSRPPRSERRVRRQPTACARGSVLRRSVPGPPRSTARSSGRCSQPAGARSASSARSPSIPRLWDRGIGGRLLRPVLEAFATLGASVKPGSSRSPTAPSTSACIRSTASGPDPSRLWPPRRSARTRGARKRSSRGAGSAGDALVLDEIRGLTDQVFRGLDLGREIAAVNEQGIGDTVLVRGKGALDGMAVCHCGAGSEAGSDTCYVKFAAVRPGDGRSRRGSSGSSTPARRSRRSRAWAVSWPGVNTGRLDAYRRLLARGFHAEQIGVAMRLRPEEPHFDTPAHYVIDDLR